MDINKITEQIIGSAIEVHRILGPGLLESAYQECMSHEFEIRGIAAKSKHPLPLNYKGHRLKKNYEVDLLVEDKVVVELKAVQSLDKLHEAQLLTYLKLGGWKVGLLINFNVPVLKDGIRRMVCAFTE